MLLLHSRVALAPACRRTLSRTTCARVSLTTNSALYRTHSSLTPIRLPSKTIIQTCSSSLVCLRTSMMLYARRSSLAPCWPASDPGPVLGQRHSFGIMLRPCWHPVTTCQQQARLRFPPPGAAPSPGMTQTRRPRAAPPPPARRTGGAPSPTLSAPPAAPGAEYAGVTAQRIRYAVEEVERTRAIKRMCAGARAPLASL